jgi:hypothetical protein
MYQKSFSHRATTTVEVQNKWAAKESVKF